MRLSSAQHSSVRKAPPRFFIIGFESVKRRRHSPQSRLLLLGFFTSEASYRTSQNRAVISSNNSEHPASPSQPKPAHSIYMHPDAHMPLTHRCGPLSRRAEQRRAPDLAGMRRSRCLPSAQPAAPRRRWMPHCARAHYHRIRLKTGPRSSFCSFSMPCAACTSAAGRGPRACRWERPTSHRCYAAHHAHTPGHSVRQTLQQNGRRRSNMLRSRARPRFPEALPFALMRGAGVTCVFTNGHRTVQYLETIFISKLAQASSGGAEGRGAAVGRASCGGEFVGCGRDFCGSGFGGSCWA
jgi:hypothetical protein